MSASVCLYGGPAKKRCPCRFHRGTRVMSIVSLSIYGKGIREPLIFYVSKSIMFIFQKHYRFVMLFVIIVNIIIIGRGGSPGSQILVIQVGVDHIIFEIGEIMDCVFAVVFVKKERSKVIIIQNNIIYAFGRKCFYSGMSVSITDAV